VLLNSNIVVQPTGLLLLQMSATDQAFSQDLKVDLIHELQFVSMRLE
jgi:hypothetical protein